MNLYVALQMDPVEDVSINADSTFGWGSRHRRVGIGCSNTLRTGCPIRKGA